MFPVDHYVSALRAIELSEVERQVLIAQYQMPQRTSSPAQLAEKLGYRDAIAVHGIYGRLGHRIAEILDPRSVRPDPEDRYTRTELEGQPVWITYLSSWERTQGENPAIVWTMRPNLARALEELGIVG